MDAQQAEPPSVLQGTAPGGEEGFLGGDPARGREAALKAAGWMSPRDTETLVQALQVLAEGRFMEMPQGEGTVHDALRQAARGLGKQFSRDLKGMVKLAVELNDGMIASVRMYRAAQETNHRSQTIATAAEELVASVEEIANHGNSVADEVTEVRGAVSRGEDAAGAAGEAMTRITSTVDSAAHQAESLASASQEVGQILGMIEEIAFQTNILALNASVEAARAGEAGKGFAVVAEEVKRLADQAKDAAGEINKRIRHVRTEMDGIIASMREVSSVVEEGRTAIRSTGETTRQISERIDHVSDRVQEIAGILEQQKTAARDVAEGISVISQQGDDTLSQLGSTVDTFDRVSDELQANLDRLSHLSLPNLPIHLAKSDHALWKKRVVSALVGRTQLASAELSDHHQCRFGRWYDRNTGEAVAEKSAFREIADPHAQVHAHGRRAVDYINSGQFDEALREIQQMETSSQHVLNCLNQLAP